MAWYAEQKRTRKAWLWYHSMIRYYRQYLYDEWYNSLTPEEIEELKEKKKHREEEEQRELEQAVAHLMMMPLVLGSIYGSML